MQNRQTQNREPLICSTLPERPWQRIAADFGEHKNENYLIVVDYYSRFIEILKMSNTSATATLKALMSLYARYGFPEEVVTDNGPQFSAEEFKNFHSKYDIIHTTSSPLYPQGNGEAESAVKTSKAILQQDDVMIGLLAYRSTPIPSLGYSPAQLFLSRPIKNTMPTV
jgi:transposase InsO family protein